MKAGTFSQNYVIATYTLQTGGRRPTKKGKRTYGLDKDVLTLSAEVAQIIELDNTSDNQSVPGRQRLLFIFHMRAPVKIKCNRAE
jgi:hypothetical protein